MKKLLSLVVALVAVVIFVPSVSAMTNSELINYACGQFTVNGKTVELPANYKKLVKDYLTEYPVSDANADTIKSKIDAAVAIMEAANVNDVTKLSQAKKNEVLALAEDAASAAGAHISYTTGSHELTVYVNGSTTPYAKLNTNDDLVQTGTNAYVYVAAVGAVALIAGAVVVYRKKASAN